jgi:hypothetical protein
MAQCNFSIPFSITSVQVSEKARMAITNAGGNFQGNESAGNFDVSTPLGDIRGSYIIEQQMIHVVILSKPFLVSCGMIEKQLRGYFANAA